MKKCLCLFLALLLTMPALVSCASESNETTPSGGDTAAAETTPAETETTRENYPDTLPALDFEGITMNIQGRGDASSMEEIGVEELNGEAVNDAVFERNRMVEERLNVDLVPIAGDGWETYGNTISGLRSSIAAADGAYDIVAGWSARIPSLSLEGLFLDLNNVKHLDFAQPWWNRSITEELQIAGKLYFVTGDLAQSMLFAMYVYAFNQKVATDHGVEDLYTVVNEKRWTMDYVSQLVSSIYVDLDGDGARTTADLYGLHTSQTNAADSYLQGFHVSMVSRDDAGLPYMDTDTERLTTIVEKLYALMYENEGTYVSDYDSTDVVSFSEDRALFATTVMASVTSTFADMESDFGLLPYPMLDESQGKYGTRVQDALSLWCVPIDAKNAEASGAVMEALGAQSYRTVTPAYFDVALKNRYSRDTETANMIDLIKDSILLNFEAIYNESFGSPYHVLRNLMVNKSSNFASFWASNEKNIITKLAEAVEMIEALD